jgi:hypothetical protein
MEFSPVASSAERRFQAHPKRLARIPTLPPITTMPERGVYAASSFESPQPNRLLIPTRTLKRLKAARRGQCADAPQQPVDADFSW